LLFGPAGAGKTSLIKTFYKAIYGDLELPEGIRKLLTVKSKVANEGTTQFTKVILKPYNRVTSEIPKSKPTKETTYQEKNHEIVIHDTRGQIWMDAREKA
jgi:GTPase SAR1 family protein